METIVKLYSTQKNEISRFLNSFFSEKIENNTLCSRNMDMQYYSILEWEKKYQNPLEMVDIIGTFIENNNKFKINMWIGLDKDIFINVTENNADALIRYMYERYPW